MSNKPFVKVTGNLKTDSGEPLVGARIRHLSSRRAATSQENGNFEIIFPRSKVQKQSFLLVIAPDLWPKKLHFVVPSDDTLINLENIIVEKIPEILRDKWWAKIITWAAPQLLNVWLGLSKLEQRLIGLIILIFFMAILPVAVAFGLPLPGTELDEIIREAAQRRPFIRALIPIETKIRFKKVRSRYYSGVSYVIGAGTNIVRRVGKEGVVIEKEATLSIEPNTTFLLERGASFLVFGTLTCEGSQDKHIVFERANPNEAWGNLTFWEPESSASTIKYTDIRGGGGRGVKATAESLMRNESGAAVGGALLVYNTSIFIGYSTIENCSANYGGAGYIRNDLQLAGGSSKNAHAMPGSRFVEVRIKRCQGSKGGGGLFIKGAYPEFEACKFAENRAGDEVPSACGGGVYVGQKSRTKFTDCTFDNNSAVAEGGGAYIYQPLNEGDEHSSGVVFRGTTFSRNQAYGAGGALSSVDARLSLSNIRFENNSVRMRGDYATDAKAAGAGAYLLYSRAFKAPVPVEISGCLFFGNRAESPEGIPIEKAHLFCGGALVFDLSVPLRVVSTDLTFNGNVARFGAHVALLGAKLLSTWKLDSSILENPRANGNNAIFEKDWAHEASIFAIPVPLETSHKLPSACYSTRRNYTNINAIVIHFISAVNVSPEKPYDLDTILRIFQGTVGENTPKTSSHFLIDKEGIVFELVDPALKAWHAGRSALASGETDVNEFSIGIEMVRLESDPPTEPQYLSLARLIHALQQKFPAITIERVVGHDTVRALWNRNHPTEKDAVKSDPGPLFEWLRLASLLEMRNH